MINKNLDKKYNEPELFISEVLKIIKKDNSSDIDTNNAVTAVLKENDKALSDYRQGKSAVIGFLIGMVQKRLKGNGNIKLIKDKILENINKLP